MLKYLAGAALCYFDLHSDIKKSIYALNYKYYSKGTCFIISKSGLALSCFHPLESDPASTSDGTLIQVLATSEEQELSLLQLPPNTSYSPLAISNSALVPGEVVYHYGYGMGSLIGNKGFYHGEDDMFMYASTEMMHGQSGGPVVNAKGEVVALCKGHFYCNSQVIKEQPYHTGPSLYVPARTILSFLNTHCEQKSSEWKLKQST